MVNFTKEDLINIFVKYLEESEVLEQYMGIEEIKAKLNDIIHTVEVKDLSEMEAAGYWCSEKNLVALSDKLEENTKRRNHVIVHELLHALTTIGTMVCGVERQYQENRGLNEGITEYLAQLICPSGDDFNYKYNDKISFKHKGAYPLEQIIVKQLAILYGENKIINAYLNNKDLEIPEEQYNNLRNNLDIIDERDSKIRNIRNGRNEKELTEDEKKRIANFENVITDAFLESQECFLEQCLSNEIDNISTIEQAKSMQWKLRRLNQLDIKIEGNEKANYDKYNFKFIRKYLELVNKDKIPEEQISFDTVEAFIKGEGELIPENKRELVIKNENFYSKLRITLNAIKSKFVKKESEFVPIDRGNEGKIYLKECGQETIGGKFLKQYQYFTEQEYLDIMSGNKEHKGQVLRGDINFKKLKKDKLYAKAISEQLLSDANIENCLMNYLGYVGFVENYQKQADEMVQKRVEADKKCMAINPEGYGETLYIIKENEAKDKSFSNYVMLTREELTQYKENPNIGIHIKGVVDVDRLEFDEKYKSYVERHFLTKDKIDRETAEYEGFVGEVRENGFAFSNYSEPSLQERYAKAGVNGEQKVITRSDNLENFYIRELGCIGEKDFKGNDIYRYELITSDEMIKMRSNSKFGKDLQKEKLYITSTKEDLNNLKNYDFRVLLMFGGGCISDSEYRNCCMNKNTNIRVFDGLDMHLLLFECNGQMYVVPYDNYFKPEFFDFRVPLEGNIDINRINFDAKYERFIKAMFENNYDNLMSGNELKGFEIIEEEGKLSYKCIEDKKEITREDQMER